MILPRPPRRRGPLALSLVAMVDVVMNLLFFFMMAARFPAWRTLPLDLGGRAEAPTGAEAVLAPPVKLTLLPTGAIAWNGTPTPRGEILNRLAAEPTRPARVEAVAGVPFQDTLALIEALRTVSTAVTLDVPESVVAAATGAGAAVAPDSGLPVPETLGIPAPDSTNETPEDSSLVDYLPGGTAATGTDGALRGPASGGSARMDGGASLLPPPPADPGASAAPGGRTGYVPDRPSAVTYDPGVANRPASALPDYDDPYWTREKPAARPGATPAPDSRPGN